MSSPHHTGHRASFRRQHQGPWLQLRFDIGVQTDNDWLVIDSGCSNGIPPCAGDNQRLAGRRWLRFFQVNLDAEFVMCFGAAHFWVPVHFPGSIIPLQIVATAPMVFFAAWYFLRFRNILALTMFHAIFYVLYSQWVEHVL